jgi:hypothetical protein
MLLPPPSLSDGLLTSRASWRCSKESRGARVASRKDLWWDQNDNNKDQQQQQLDILLRIYFYNFELSCIFILTLLVFLRGRGILQKRCCRRRETTAWHCQCCGEFTWRLERERELGGHGWALDLVDYLLTLVELAIACVKFSLYKKIGIFFWF